MPLRQIVGVKPRNPIGAPKSTYGSWSCSMLEGFPFSIHLWKTFRWGTNLHQMLGVQNVDVRFDSGQQQLQLGVLQQQLQSVQDLLVQLVTRDSVPPVPPPPPPAPAAPLAPVESTRETPVLPLMKAWHCRVSHSNIDPFWGKILWWNRGDAGRSLEISRNVFQNIQSLKPMKHGKLVAGRCLCWWFRGQVLRPLSIVSKCHLGYASAHVHWSIDLFEGDR